MQAHDDQHEADVPPAIRDRTDTGGRWSTAWPLIALALIGLMIIRTCVPSPTGAASAPPAAVTTPASR